MKKKLATNIGAMVGAALLSVSTNVAALGEADGIWLKLVYRTIAGQQINTASGDISRANSKGTCYAQLIYTPDGVNPGVDPGTYAGAIMCEEAPDVFEATGGSINLTEVPGGLTAFAESDAVQLTNPSGHDIDGRGNGLLTIKLDRDMNFRKARFKSLASALEGARLDPTNTDLVMIGGLSIKGTSIDASKLPF